MNIVEQQDERLHGGAPDDERDGPIEHREAARGIGMLAEVADARCTIIANLQRPQDLHPRPERGRQADLGRAPPDDLRASSGAAGRKLAEQAALADARLARQDEDRAFTSSCASECLVENTELAIATDQRRHGTFISSLHFFAFMSNTDVEVPATKVSALSVSDFSSLPNSMSMTSLNALPSWVPL